MGSQGFFGITSNDIIALVAVYVLIIAVLAIALTVQKKTGDKHNIRKIIHIGIGNFVFIWWLFDHSWVMEIFFAIPFAIVLFFAMLKDNKIANSTLGDISKKQGHAQGLFFYVVSIIIVVALCFKDHWAAASIGIIAMTWGDGFGSIFGKKYGKHKTINGKSLEGTLTILVTTAIMSFVVMSFFGFIGVDFNLTAIIPTWAACILAGVVISLTEMLTPGNYDNIINCLSVTLVMALIGL